MSHRLVGTFVALLLCGTAAPLRAQSALDDYVKKEDTSFKWTVEKTLDLPAGKVTRITLQSQVWEGIPWTHALQIFEPAEIKYPNAMLLFITGGSNKNMDRPEDAATGFGLARLCGARVAVLPQVPNQPLLGDKTEDALIAETFVRYLETKDASWPLLFPMTKSAVKAMDAIQAWGKKDGNAEITKFVVTGGSKRGWTTWLTGVVDSRVVAIAPMVIDTLNMKAQRDHALEVWGKPSEQVGDYTSRGLDKTMDEPAGAALWKMVDPYFYINRVTKPKLLINGTKDRYWTIDALNIYWDELKGPKSVVYVPNAGHNLAVNRDYALNGIGAFFRYNLSGRPWPQLSWEHTDGPDKALVLTVKSTPEPKSAKVWTALSDTRDFRESTWVSTPMATSGSISKSETPRPAKGYIALFGDLEFEVDGVPFHLSTQVRQPPENGVK